MPEIIAAEPNRLQVFLEAKENASDAQRQAAQATIDAGIDEGGGGYTVDGDTARFDVCGVLRKTESRLARILGFNMTSYAGIIKACQEIKALDAVKTVRVSYDTPGGYVDGLDEAWQAMADLAKSKTVIAEVRGMLCSAGYYLASPSSRIESSAPSNMIGSIGVVTVYTSYKGMDEKYGIKEIVIRSKNAPDKNPDIESKKGQEVIQRAVDALERIFYQRIAAGRKISVEEIADRFGRGDVFVSQDPDPDKPDAIKAGMIDAVTARFTVKNTTKKAEVKSMALKDLMATDPAIKAEVDALAAENFIKGQQSGADRVEARVKKVAPYIGADSTYPGPIKTLALDVLLGKEEPAALSGAVAVYDATREEQRAKAATTETTQAGETQAGTGGAPAANTGAVETEADFEAAAKRLRGVK